MTSSSKVFEALYVAWIYMLYQKVSALDFAGLTPDSPWYLYAPLALVLLVLAWLARAWQLTAKHISK